MDSKMKPVGNRIKGISKQGGQFTISLMPGQPLRKEDVDLTAEESQAVANAMEKLGHVNGDAVSDAAFDAAKQVLDEAGFELIVTEGESEDAQG